MREPCTDPGCHVLAVHSTRTHPIPYHVQHLAAGPGPHPRHLWLACHRCSARLPETRSTLGLWCARIDTLLAMPGRQVLRSLALAGICLHRPSPPLHMSGAGLCWHNPAHACTHPAPAQTPRGPCLQPHERPARVRQRVTCPVWQHGVVQLHCTEHLPSRRSHPPRTLQVLMTLPTASLCAAKNLPNAVPPQGACDTVVELCSTIMGLQTWALRWLTLMGLQTRASRCLCWLWACTCVCAGCASTTQRPMLLRTRRPGLTIRVSMRAQRNPSTC